MINECNKGRWQVYFSQPIHSTPSIQFTSVRPSQLRSLNSVQSSNSLQPFSLVAQVTAVNSVNSLSSAQSLISLESPNSFQLSVSPEVSPFLLLDSSSPAPQFSHLVQRELDLWRDSLAATPINVSIGMNNCYLFLLSFPLPLFHVSLFVKFPYSLFFFFSLLDLASRAIVSCKLSLVREFGCYIDKNKYCYIDKKK